MRSYSEFLPFLKYARTVGLRNINVPMDRVLNINAPENIEGLTEDMTGIIQYIKIPFYYERNLDLYIPMCRTRLEYIAIAIRVAQGGTNYSPVIDIDYSDIARNIEIEELTSVEGEETGSMIASLDVAHGELTSEIVSDMFINLASNRMPWNPSEPTEVEGIFTESVDLNSSKYSDEKLKEAFVLNPSASIDTRSEKVGVDAEDAYEEYVYNYIKSGKMLAKNRVPLLIGTTAVAKSSLIKSIVNRLDGYRLIDFRSAFIDKNDIEGFATKLKDSNNEYYAEMSPMRELVEATDEYLDYAKNALDGIEDKLKTLMTGDQLDEYDRAFNAYRSAESEEAKTTARGELKDIMAIIGNSKDVKQLLELRRLYAEKAKTPVLFFDEITRAPKEARNAFTTILNTKSFLNYHMTRARIVAATNYPVGMPEEYIMVYTTEEIDDIAALERFEPFIVMPDEVYPRWNKWAEQNLIAPVVQFIATSPKKYAYALETVMDTIDNSNGELDEYAAAELPFPNFRTWEFVSNYLKSTLERGEVFDMKMIYSLIGDNPVSNDLYNYLKKNHPEYVKNDASNLNADDRDEFAENLRSGILANVPVLLSGPTSYGKTTRVKNIADELDAILIEINLATKDATQIKGIPTPVPVADTVLYGSNIDATTLPPDIQDLLKDTRKFGVSGNTTDYMPDKYVRDMLLEASKTGRPVILFFDEVNRCDKTVLSSVFEAVSDNRYMGVTFKPGQVRVVAAANLGGQYGDVTQLDPAFSARFAMVRKDEYDLKDVASFKKYVDSTDINGNPRYSKVVADYIKAQDDNELLDALVAVEERTLLRATPTMRAWDDISQMIMNSDKDNPFIGKVVFNVNTPQGDALDELSRVRSASDINLDSVENAFKNFPPNWVGHLSPTKITLPQLGTFTTQDLQEGALMILGQLRDPNVPSGDKDNYASQLKAMVQGFKELEVKLLKNRQTMIEAKLGTEFDIVERFTEYYNSVSGDTLIQLSDLVDASLIQPYVGRRLNGLANDQLIAGCSDFVGDFMKEFNGNLSEKHYQTVIDVCHDMLRYQDAMLEWWGVGIKSPTFKALVTMATKSDKQYNYDVLNRLGVPVASYTQEIEDFYA